MVTTEEREQLRKALESRLAAKIEERLIDFVH